MKRVKRTAVIVIPKQPFINWANSVTESFQNGLQVELEHGLEYSSSNVTNNHPILTAKIVLAHLKEMLDYYERLDVAEGEGDLLKAIIAGDLSKIRRQYARLLTARKDLAQSEEKLIA